MNRNVATFSGVIVLIGTVLSVLFQQLGWYNWDTIITNMTWLNAFGGTGIEYSDSVVTTYSKDIGESIAGILALAGAILLLTRTRIGGIVGGILVLVAIGMFVYQISVNDTVQAIADAFFDGKWFWNETDNIILRFGYGFFVVAAGGVMGLIASIPPDK